MRNAFMKTVAILMLANGAAQTALAQATGANKTNDTLEWVPYPHTVSTNSTVSPAEQAETIGVIVGGVVFFGVACCCHEHIGNGLKKAGHAIRNCCASLCRANENKQPLVPTTPSGACVYSNV